MLLRSWMVFHESNVQRIAGVAIIFRETLSFGVLRSSAQKPTNQQS